MISKNSCWVRIRENLKRRGWTVLLCMLSMFLVLPVCQAMAISVDRKNVENGTVYYMGIFDGPEWVARNFMNAVSFDQVLLIITAAFAVLFAIQGFSWLYSRKKTDMYMSMPVSSVKRYITIYLNGIGIYGVCYFCALLLAFAVGGVLGAFSVKTILFGLGGFLCNMLFFTAVYNLSIMAVMLTGNVLVTLMGCSVFLLYEYMIRFLMDGMQSAFFRTYCSFGNTTSNSWTSPVFTYLNGISDMSSYLWGNGSRYMVSFLEKLAVIAVQALVYGIAAYVLYRKRKAEAAGMAMAFTKSKSVIKLLLMIPVTLLAGLWFRGLSGDSVFFTVLGMLIGLLLSHGLIQIIYEFDIHSVLNKKWHILAAGAAAAAIFSAVYFDFTGYDTYIPETDEIASVAFTFRQDIYGFSNYERLFEKNIYYSNHEEYMLSHMESEDTRTIEAIRTLAARDHEKEVDMNFYDDSNVVVYLKYNLKNGRSLCRAAAVDLEQSLPEMDTIFADRSYQYNRYQINDPVMTENADLLKAVFSNGLEEVSYLGDMSRLLKVLSEDLDDYSCSMMMNQLPVGSLSFRYHVDGEPEGNYYSWTYPVYPDFEDTISLLKEQGAYKELAEDYTFVDAGRVVSISVTCYNLKESDVFYSKNGGRSVSYSNEQIITETFTDEEDIKKICPALYPRSLMDISGSGITGRLQDDNYDISVTFKPGMGLTSSNVGFVPIMDRIPAFVIEKTTAKTE